VKDQECGLEPSVAQPPLPLQLFLPLQPLSPLLQPPLPLQEFWPLQACFSGFFEESFLSCVSCAEKKEDFALTNTVEAWTAAPVPASRPATAALVMRALVVFVMGISSLQFEVFDSPSGQGPASEGRGGIQAGRVREVPGDRSPSRLANPRGRKATAPVRVWGFGKVTPGEEKRGRKLCAVEKEGHRFYKLLLPSLGPGLV